MFANKINGFKRIEFVPRCRVLPRAIKFEHFISMDELGKFLVGALICAGVGKNWLGRLPDDIHCAREGREGGEGKLKFHGLLHHLRALRATQKIEIIPPPNFSFYFPIVTCLLTSAALTLLMWWFRR